MSLLAFVNNTATADGSAGISKQQAATE